MIEKYGAYEFEIFGSNTRCATGGDDEFVYRYEIYGDGDNDSIVGSSYYYETDQEARFAAIGHITKLEQGEE